MTRLLSIGLFLLSPTGVMAAMGDPTSTLTVTIGTESPLMAILMGLGRVLVVGMVPITAAIITIGGVMMAAAHGNDSWQENGKKAIEGGLIGFCVVMGSYGILRMIVNFIYF